MSVMSVRSPGFPMAGTPERDQQQPHRPTTGLAMDVVTLSVPPASNRGPRRRAREGNVPFTLWQSFRHGYQRA
jgi:hypothetical protein